MWQSVVATNLRRHVAAAVVDSVSYIVVFTTVLSLFFG